MRVQNDHTATLGATYRKKAHTEWMACLLDGAFSIGRVTTADPQQDSSHQPSPAANPYGIVTGFLLRSAVVAGWPDVQVDTYDEVVDHDDAMPDTHKLSLWRMQRLSANVLICLFHGEATTVDIHQKPEALYFGLDPKPGSAGFEKHVRTVCVGDDRRSREGQIPHPQSITHLSVIFGCRKWVFACRI